MVFPPFLSSSVHTIFVASGCEIYTHVHMHTYIYAHSCTNNFVIPYMRVVVHSILIFRFSDFFNFSVHPTYVSFIFLTCCCFHQFPLLSHFALPIPPHSSSLTCILSYIINPLCLLATYFHYVLSIPVIFIHIYILSLIFQYFFTILFFCYAISYFAIYIFC